MPVDFNKLTDVSRARVFSGGGISLDGSTATTTTFKALTDTNIAAGGWRRDFTTTVGAAAERGVNGVLLAAGAAIFPGFTPSARLCNSEGSSLLFGLSFVSGTPTPDGVFDQIPCDCNNGVVESPVNPYTHTGAGNAASNFTKKRYVGRGQSVSLSASGNQVTGSTSTGAVNIESVSLPFPTRNGEIGWREFRDDQ